MGGVDESIERAFGDDGVGEQRIPIRRRAIRGDDERSAGEHALAHELVVIPLPAYLRDRRRATPVQLDDHHVQQRPG